MNPPESCIARITFSSFPLVMSVTIRFPFSIQLWLWGLFPVMSTRCHPSFSHEYKVPSFLQSWVQGAILQSWVQGAILQSWVQDFFIFPSHKYRIMSIFPVWIVKCIPIQSWIQGFLLLYILRKSFFPFLLLYIRFSFSFSHECMIMYHHLPKCQSQASFWHLLIWMYASFSSQGGSSIDLTFWMCLTIPYSLWTSAPMHCV